MKLMLLKLYINIRWAYFHLSPSHVKFSITSDGESYFQNVKTGEIKCNFTIVKGE